MTSPEMQPTSPRPRVAPFNGSLVIKRSVTVHGHRTSIALEDPFWSELKRLALDRELSAGELVHQIREGMARGQINLSSQIRLFILRELLSERELSRAIAAATGGTIAATANDNRN